MYHIILPVYQYSIEEDGKYYHVGFVVDAFTKWVIADKMDSKSAINIAHFLWEKVYCFLLAPSKCLIHDRDSSLAAEIVKSLHSEFGTDIRVTSAGNKEANGQVERVIKTFKTRMNAVLLEYPGISSFCFLIN